MEDLVCFSHLRWNFVYQRPPHLLSRSSRQWRIWYVEEPVWQDALHLEVRGVAENIWVVVPHLPHSIDEQTAVWLQRQLVNQLLDEQNITKYIAWYYTPMALPFAINEATRYISPTKTPEYLAAVPVLSTPIRDVV